MSERSFKAGQIIFRKGDASDAAYLVESGEAEVFDEQSGREVRIAILGKGDILGDMGLVEQPQRFLTARAITEVRASPLTREIFTDQMLRRPEESLRYLRAVFTRLRSTCEVLMYGDKVAPILVSAHTPFKATLVPITDQAAKTVPAAGLAIHCSPFRVGRAPAPDEVSLEPNELLLADAQPYHVSRKHFSIEIRADGVFVQDRGSRLGTLVNGNPIGDPNRTGPEKLSIGKSEIIAGSQLSPFRFRIDVLAVD
jgi:CRP/FNR family transcriptional regulator, cyclic AMP receptor protein